jgi:predicted DNA-binding WGR domain protein
MLNIRLELHDRSKNSHKYYMLQDIGKKTGMVLVRWGRCLGRDIINGEQIIEFAKAMDKLREKRRKGYVDVY